MTARTYPKIETLGVELQSEGIVARTEPLLFTRRGDRLMFKLKTSDWKAGKR